MTLSIKNKWLLSIEDIEIVFSICFSLLTSGSVLIKVGLLFLTSIINVIGFNFIYYFFQFEGFKNNKKLFNLQDTAGFFTIIISGLCYFIPKLLFPVSDLTGPALLGWEIGYYLFEFNGFSVCYGVIYWLLFWRQYQK
ncbi:hypothetical protein [Lentilactobacillus hilgardii]|uniref:hypothetical protein n=1 Tax=Lentilactobacillus hilgardii TaxID=1588 RepID=UPI0039EC8A68